MILRLECCIELLTPRGCFELAKGISNKSNGKRCFSDPRVSEDYEFESVHVAVGVAVAGGITHDGASGGKWKQSGIVVVVEPSASIVLFLCA